MNGKAAKGTFRVTVMLGNNLTDRETLAVLELLQPESPPEVQGLYIEDSELLSLAEVPVVREYCRLTQAGRRLQVEDLERQFRTQARMAERALAETVTPVVTPGLSGPCGVTRWPCCGRCWPRLT